MYIYKEKDRRFPLIFKISLFDCVTSAKKVIKIMCDSAAQQIFYPTKPMVSGYDPITYSRPQDFKLRPKNNTPSEEVTDELTVILVECLKKLDAQSRGSLLLKFFSEMEKEMNLEDFILDRLKHSKVNAISERCDNIPSAHPTMVRGKDYHHTSMRELQESEKDERLERYSKLKLCIWEGQSARKISEI